MAPKRREGKDGGGKIKKGARGAGSRRQPRQAGLHRWRNAHSSSRGGGRRTEDGGGRARRVLFGIPPCAAWTWPGRITIIPCPASEGGKPGVALCSRPPAAAILSLAAQQVKAYITPAALGGGQSERLQAGFGAGFVASSHLPSEFRGPPAQRQVHPQHYSGASNRDLARGLTPRGGNCRGGIGESREFCRVGLIERG